MPTTEDFSGASLKSCAIHTLEALAELHMQPPADTSAALVWAACLPVLTTPSLLSTVIEAGPSGDGLSRGPKQLEAAAAVRIAELAAHCCRGGPPNAFAPVEAMLAAAIPGLGQRTLMRAIAVCASMEPGRGDNIGRRDAQRIPPASLPPPSVSPPLLLSLMKQLGINLGALSSEGPGALKNTSAAAAALSPLLRTAVFQEASMDATTTAVAATMEQVGRR